MNLGERFSVFCNDVIRSLTRCSASRRDRRLDVPPGMAVCRGAGRPREGVPQGSTSEVSQSMRSPGAPGRKESGRSGRSGLLGRPCPSGRTEGRPVSQLSTWRPGGPLGWTGLSHMPTWTWDCGLECADWLSGSVGGAGALAPVRRVLLSPFIDGETEAERAGLACPTPLAARTWPGSEPASVWLQSPRSQCDLTLRRTVSRAHCVPPGKSHTSLSLSARLESEAVAEGLSWGSSRAAALARAHFAGPGTWQWPVLLYGIHA